MFTVDFGEQGGGRHSFKGYAELHRHLTSESDAWLSDEIYRSIGNRSGELQPLVQHWLSVRDTLESMWVNHGQNLQAIMDNVQQVIASRNPISLSSALGKMIRSMMAGGSTPQAAGAVRYATIGGGEVIYHNQPSKAQWDGVFAAWAVTSNWAGPANGVLKRSYKALVDRLSAQVEAHRSELETYQADREAAFNAFDAAAQQRRDDLEFYQRQVAGEIIAQRDVWAGEWKELAKHYEEELRISSSVKLWEDRAKAHSDSFKNTRKWVLRLGVGGTLVIGVLTIIAAYLMFGGDEEPGLHVLIYAASLTLLFLTMFLWLMRILVRMMMSEHHLSIDAQSRANMAHTYLALLESNGAADEKDRAIVLASLFRPVTDGLVKDDALPLISPATILSGKLSQ